MTMIDQFKHFDSNDQLFEKLLSVYEICPS